jgi:hypothetical protein
MDQATILRIWQQIKGSSLDYLRDPLVDSAVRYAEMRVCWLLADPQRQADLGADRTRCHNALIGMCDAMARNMAKQGEDASWREELGDDRKRIGDFACHLHCILGLSAR